MVKPRLKQWLTTLLSLPKEYTIPSVVTILLLLVSCGVFLPEKPVNFSYSQPSCARYFTLFPNLFSTASPDGYRAYASDVIQVGSLPLASLSICFAPTDVPKVGVAKISITPAGVLKKTFALQVPEPPLAHLDPLTKPVPATKPLTIPLSTTDRVYTYSLTAKKATVECASIDSATSCDMAKLGLLQGQPYELSLNRYFNDKKVATLAKKSVMTLPAVRVLNSSVKPGEMVFSKPRSFDFSFDKKIKKAKLILYKIEGDKRTPVTTAIRTGNTAVHMDITDDLARQADYEVEIASVEASDGSGLESPYKLPFKVSGGPRVKSISIGSTSVSAKHAVITLDQPVADHQDTAKAVSVSGGAKVVSLKGTQLTIDLSDVPKCGDFTIKITDALRSSYDITGGSTWQHNGRTVCYSIQTIGQSSRGQPINAYIFGNGQTVIMYTGAIHGSESNTRDLMRQWVDDLETNARRIPADKTVVVVPEINPDGIAVGSRTNARNVDLNRNFATGDWKKDITTVNNQAFPGGGGNNPMSEPETRAIADLASRLRPRLILSFHSVGGVVVANQSGDSAALASRYSQLSGYRNVTGSSGSTFEYSVTGTADDWYAQKLGIASILVELSSSSSSQFTRNQKALWAMLN